MGAGASIPRSEEDALQQGYTREEIDNYLANEPSARRSTSQIKTTKAKLQRHESNYGITGETSKHITEQQQFMDQININYLIYDQCKGVWETIAREIPYTNPSKMKSYVEDQLLSYEKQLNAQGSKIQDDEDSIEKKLEKQRRSLFAKGQDEGLFYD